MSWILWVIGYYFVSRLLLITGAIFIFDADVVEPDRRDDMPWGVIFCIPFLGDFWVLVSPLLLSFGFFEWFSILAMNLNARRKSKKSTKAKLLELRDIQLKIQEEALDRELEETRQTYNKRQMT